MQVCITPPLHAARIHLAVDIEDLLAWSYMPVFSSGHTISCLPRCNNEGTMLREIHTRSPPTYALSLVVAIANHMIGVRTVCHERALMSWHRNSWCGDPMQSIERSFRQGHNMYVVDYLHRAASCEATSCRLMAEGAHDACTTWRDGREVQLTHLAPNLAQSSTAGAERGKRAEPFDRRESGSGRLNSPDSFPLAPAPMQRDYEKTLELANLSVTSTTAVPVASPAKRQKTKRQPIQRQRPRLPDHGALLSAARQQSLSSWPSISRLISITLRECGMSSCQGLRRSPSN
jgi:hypothetical protein